MGGDEHALAGRRRQLEQRVPRHLARRLVEQAVLAGAGGDAEGVAAHLAVHLVGVQAGGVHHGAGGKLAVRGGQPIAAAAPLDALHLLVEVEFDAVGGGVFGEGDGHFVGAGDAAGRGVQGGDRLPADVRLHLLQALPVDYRQLRDAVFPAARQQALEDGARFLVQAEDEGADALERELQLPRPLLEHGVAGDVGFRLEAARLGVVAGVDDGRVGLAGAGRHVGRGVEGGDGEAAARQLPGDGAADHPGSYDDDIVHMFSVHADWQIVRIETVVLCMVNFLIVPRYPDIHPHFLN